MIPPCVTNAASLPSPSRSFCGTQASALTFSAKSRSATAMVPGRSASESFQRARVGARRARPLAKALYSSAEMVTRVPREA